MEPITSLPKCFRITVLTGLSAYCIYGMCGMAWNTYDLLYSEADAHGSWPFNPGPAKAVLAILQAFLVCSFIIGVLATCKKDRAYYFLSSLSLLAVGAVMIVFGIVCIRASQHNLQANILQKLSREGEWQDFHWMEWIQKWYKCCGIRSHNDWSEINGQMNPNDDGKGFALTKFDLPPSCCRTNYSSSPTDSDCGVNALKSNISEVKKYFYIKPCGPEFVPQIRKNLERLGVEMLIVGLSSIASAAFIYCGASELFCLSKQTNYRQQYTRRENPMRSRRSLGAGEDDTDDNSNDGEDGDDEADNGNPGLGKGHSKSRKTQNDDGSSVKSSGAKSRKKSKSNKGPGPHFGTIPSGKPKGDKNGAFGSGVSKKGKSLKERGKRSRLSRDNNHGSLRHGKTKPPHSKPEAETEMLYHANDMNSTISTTPNPSGSSCFAWTNNINRNESSPPPPSSSLRTQSKSNSMKTLAHFYSSSSPQFQVHQYYHRGTPKVEPIELINFPPNAFTNDQIQVQVLQQSLPPELPPPPLPPVVVSPVTVAVQMTETKEEEKPEPLPQEAMVMAKSEGNITTVSNKHELDEPIFKEEAIDGTQRDTGETSRDLQDNPLLPAEATTEVNVDKTIVPKETTVADPVSLSQSSSSEATMTSSNSSVTSVIEVPLQVKEPQSQTPVLHEQAKADDQTHSDQSLGFEPHVTSSSEGEGETVPLDGEEELTHKRSKFQTLPTIVEEPESQSLSDGGSPKQSQSSVSNVENSQQADAKPTSTPSSEELTTVIISS